MKKLAIAVLLSLSLSPAFAGDLGAPQTGPSYKPASVGTVFATVFAVALSPTPLAGLAWAIAGSTAAYAIETKK